MHIISTHYVAMTVNAVESSSCEREADTLSLSILYLYFCGTTGQEESVTEHASAAVLSLV